MSDTAARESGQSHGNLDETGQSADLVSWKALIEHSPIGVVVCDGEGALCAWNGAAARLLDSDGAACPCGEPLLSIFSDLPSETRTGALRDLESKGEWRARYKGASKLGAELNCDIVVQRIEGAASSPQLCAYLTDITEQTALHQSLMQSEKLSALGEIVAGVAHELNNPLTGILGYAQLILGAVEDPKVRSRLEQIAMEATRCRQIVQSLLGFSRHYESHKASHDINGLVSDMILLREYQMRVDNVDIETVLAEDMPPVEIDRHEMQRVVLNILNNAHEALTRQENGGERRLIVQTTKTDSDVRIAIQDTGVGISGDIRGKIFDPFFSTKGVGEGTGLGLSVAYGVVREHGGEILVESTPGEGSTFTIVIPLGK